MEEKIIQRNEKLVESESSYRKVFSFCRILSGFSLIGLLSLIFLSQSENSHEYVISATNSTLFWGVIALNCKSKIEHIESIQFYKKQDNQPK